MNVQGSWFDGATSGLTPAGLTVDVNGEASLLAADDKRCLARAAFTELTISPRLGQTPRYLYFVGGGKFECRDNEIIDQWAQQWRQTPWDRWVHAIESHWHMVIVALLLVLLFGWGLVSHGVPVAAQAIAHLLPEPVGKLAGEHTLATLDELIFKPTQLSESERQRLRQHLQPALDQYSELPLKILFRDGGKIGANAFALPDGSVVFTDQMVALSRDDRELLSVFAHEIGHVAHRHGMQSLVRKSLFAFLILTVSGDVSASSELLLGLPVLLMEMSYSRDFERQADDFSLDYLHRSDIDLRHFVRLMSRLRGARSCHQSLSFNGGDDEPVLDEPVLDESGKAGEPDDTVGVNELACLRALPLEVAVEAQSSADKPEAEVGQWLGYLSSHPPTAERLENFR